MIILIAIWTLVAPGIIPALRPTSRVYIHAGAMPSLRMSSEYLLGTGRTPDAPPDDGGLPPLLFIFYSPTCPQNN